MGKDSILICGGRMKKSNRNSYTNDFLQFYIEKPEDWVFVPQKWSANYRAKSFENNQELKEKLKNALIPFVYFYKPHEDPGFPLPTVQCGCRLNGLPSGSTFEEGLQTIIDGLMNCYSQLEIIEANANFILSGYRSIFIRMKFSINNLDNRSINCLGRVIMVVTPKLIYHIGLTGSYDMKYRYEDTFKEVIYSIKLGNKHFVN